MGKEQEILDEVDFEFSPKNNEDRINGLVHLLIEERKKLEELHEEIRKLDRYNRERVERLQQRIINISRRMK